jgi:transmembrane protein 231
MKRNVYYEMPEVYFQRRVYVELDIIADATGTSSQVVYSTMKNTNILQSSRYRAGIVQASAHDENRDGKSDYFSISVRLPLSKTKKERVVRAVGVATFEYNLNARAQLRIQGMAMAEHSSAVGASQLMTDGYLRFTQEKPVAVRGGLAVPDADYVLLNVNDTSSVEATTLSYIIPRYVKRNYTTTYDYHYPVWVSAPASGADSFTLNMTVRVPETAVMYTPTVSETVKFAWVQYLAILLLLWRPTKGLLDFIFRHRLVDSVAVYEGPWKNEFGGTKLKEF